MRAKIAPKPVFEHHQNGTPYEDTFTSNGGNFSGDYIDEIQILEKVIIQTFQLNKRN